MKDLKLCYVKGNWAWFTSCSLDFQLGDGWTETPYEYSSMPPYGVHKTSDGKQKKHKIVKVAFESDYEEPCCDELRTKLSVVMINKGKIPWLKTSPYSSIELKPITAGTSLEDFIKIIRASGGDVFVPAP
jgi:hypothetical protein